MANILTLPKENAMQILETLFNSGPNKGVQMQDEKLNRWTIGIAIDEETGAEMFQIVHEELLIKAK